MKKHKISYWNSDVFQGLYQMDRRLSRVVIVNQIGKLNVKSVLSVGCGTGPLCPMIREQYPDMKYKGTDYSKRLIGFAKKEFPKEEFDVQDMRKLKESNNSWDVVIAYHSLDHVGDWKKALKEMYRVARKYAIIALWRPFTEQTKVNATGFFGDDQYKDTYLNEFSRTELETGIVQAGFSIKKRRKIEDAPNRNTYCYLLIAF